MGVARRMTTDFTHLDPYDAWARLRSQSYGRLAVSIDGQPDIYPVNFLATETNILIRTQAGTKVDDIVQNARIAFEADSADSESAWSIVVKGLAVRIDEPQALENAQHAPLWSWAPGDKNVFIRITPTEVTGRMFTRG
ncbi:pyridoxamine 5'-phosphate oxidase family protein [soil metagenome]